MANSDDELRRSRRVEYATTAQRKALARERKERGDLTFFGYVWRIVALPPLAVFLCCCLHFFFFVLALLFSLLGGKIFMICLFFFTGLFFTIGTLVAESLEHVADKLAKIFRRKGFLVYFSIWFFPLVLWWCSATVRYEYEDFPDAERWTRILLFIRVGAEFISAIGFYRLCAKRLPFSRKTSSEIFS